MATLKRIKKNPIKTTIVFASIVFGGFLVLQALSLALFGFTSQCGGPYIALTAVMTIGSCLCLPIEKHNPKRAIIYLCYLVFFGISGMTLLYCTNDPIVFPRILSVLICGVFVLRWSELKYQAIAYGVLSAVVIGLAAWACSSTIGATGVAFSILSTFLPRDKT